MAQVVEIHDGATNGAKADAAVAFAAVKPWLVVETAKLDEAVVFYKAAFGAEEVSRVNHPKRKAEQDSPLLLSAEIKLGSTTFVVSDLSEDASPPVKSAVAGGVFCLETENVGAAVSKAVAAGGVLDGEISEGGVEGKVRDPYGNVWVIRTASKIGDVAAAEPSI